MKDKKCRALATRHFHINQNLKAINRFPNTLKPTFLDLISLLGSFLLYFVFYKSVARAYHFGKAEVSKGKILWIGFVDTIATR